jgi:hypothetical protein
MSALPRLASMCFAQVSDGKLTIAINGPEAVPPFEQLQPVSAGVFDILPGYLKMPTPADTTFDASVFTDKRLGPDVTAFLLAP